MIIPALVFAVALGAFVFLLLPRAKTRQRAALSVGFVLLVGIAYAGSVDLLSRPKPWRFEWRDLGKAKVLAADMREGSAIYVWLQDGKTDEPRAYVLPWSQQTAQQLQGAMRDAQNQGTEVQMSQATEDGTDRRKPMFYALPQRPLPDKDYGGGQAQIYQRPAEEGAPAAH
jgi:hypothetical protein